MYSHPYLDLAESALHPSQWCDVARIGEDTSPLTLAPSRDKGRVDSVGWVVGGLVGTCGAGIAKDRG